MAEIASVEMKGVTKRFSRLLANDNIDFTAYKGEIHALLGENGAGKSTLMNILMGVLVSDSGEIRIHGKPVSIKTPKDALGLGIGMIYQHFPVIREIMKYSPQHCNKNDSICSVKVYCLDYSFLFSDQTLFFKNRFFYSILNSFANKPACIIPFRVA